MANIYDPGSRIPQKKIERLVSALIEDKTVASTARQENLEQNTVRGVFKKIRRRMEEDCWRSLKPFYNRIRDLEFPEGVLRRDARAENPRMTDEISLYTPAPVAIVFTNWQVSTNILMINRARLDSGYFPLEKSGVTTQDEWNERIAGCLFADLNFEPRGMLIKNRYVERQEFIKGYWRYFRANTQQRHRTDYETFYLRMKELEWRFNHLVIAQKEKIILQQTNDLYSLPSEFIKRNNAFYVKKYTGILRKSPDHPRKEEMRNFLSAQKSKTAEPPSTSLSDEDFQTSVNNQLTAYLLNLLQSFPLANFSSIDEGDIFSPEPFSPAAESLRTNITGIKIVKEHGSEVFVITPNIPA